MMIEGRVIAVTGAAYAEQRTADGIEAFEALGPGGESFDVAAIIAAIRSRHIGDAPDDGLR